MDKEGALEQSCVIVDGDESGEKVEAKPQKLADGMVMMDLQQNNECTKRLGEDINDSNSAFAKINEQPEAEAEEKDGLDDSFEDLEGEYQRNILQDELEQKQKNWLEE